MKKNYEVKFEWEVKDTRTGVFRTGTSTLVVNAKNKLDALNQTIACAGHMPSWEFERNNINLEEYREFPICTYHYETMISKIISVKAKW